MKTYWYTTETLADREWYVTHYKEDVGYSKQLDTYDNESLAMAYCDYMNNHQIKLEYESRWGLGGIK